MYALLNVVDTATEHQFDLKKTAKIYYKIGSRFDLVWLRDIILTDKSEGYWNMFARFTLRDDLDRLQKSLTTKVLQQVPDRKNINQMIESWIENNPDLMKRWSYLLEKLQSAEDINYSMFFIATRELSGLLRLQGS